MRYESKIHTVFFCHFVIISGKHDCRRPDLRSGKIQFPRHFTVKADLRKSKTARPCISCDRRMPFPKCRHISTKIKYILKLFFSCPVQPGNLVILTVGIIIPELSIAKLITCKEHRPLPFFTATRPPTRAHSPAAMVSRIPAVTTGTEPLQTSTEMSRVSNNRSKTPRPPPNKMAKARPAPCPAAGFAAASPFFAIGKSLPVKNLLDSMRRGISL